MANFWIKQLRLPVMRDGWICGKIAEANNHVLNECRKYVQKENERRYDWIGIKIQGECH